MAVVFGGVSAQLPPPEKTSFAMGGIALSFVWFFALGYGAQYCAPLLGRPQVWRIINGAIALMMFGIALSLLWYAAGY